MKRLILMCGLLASGFSFGADWVLFATNGKETKDYTEHFYDKSSIKKSNNNTVQLWVRAYEVENKFRADMSSVIYCTDRNLETKEVFYYSDNKFLNNIKYSNKVDTPPPDSVGDVLIRQICNKKAP